MFLIEFVKHGIHCFILYKDKDLIVMKAMSLIRENAVKNLDCWKYFFSLDSRIS